MPYVLKLLADNKSGGENTARERGISFDGRKNLDKIDSVSKSNRMSVVRRHMTLCGFLVLFYKFDSLN